MAYHEQKTARHGIGGWSNARWLALIAIVVVIAAAIVLFAVYGGGSGGNGGGY